MSARYGVGLKVARVASRWRSIFFCSLLLSAACAYGRNQQPAYPDPAHNPDALKPAPVNALTEQFIWTPGDAEARNLSLQSKLRGEDEEQVLGIKPTGAGFRTVNIRPDLAGLAWVRGAEPTPRGLIRVNIQPDVIQIDLPPMTSATISLAFPPKTGSTLVNDKPIETMASEDGTRSTLVLSNPGKYSFALNGGQH